MCHYNSKWCIGLAELQWTHLYGNEGRTPQLTTSPSTISITPNTQMRRRWSVMLSLLGFVLACLYEVKFTCVFHTVTESTVSLKVNFLFLREIVLNVLFLTMARRTKTSHNPHRLLSVIKTKMSFESIHSPNVGKSKRKSSCLFFELDECW